MVVHSGVLWRFLENYAGYCGKPETVSTRKKPLSERLLAPFIPCRGMAGDGED
jgi:hypothetical protein